MLRLDYETRKLDREIYEAHRAGDTSERSSRFAKLYSAYRNGSLQHGPPCHSDLFFNLRPCDDGLIRCGGKPFFAYRRHNLITPGLSFVRDISWSF